jgi:CDP-diacylglycerol--serine O-phosphatidyltransferase
MKVRHKAYNKVSPIYLLPNMFTLGAMFAGFYAIVQSIGLHFMNAGIGVLFAMILDALDGRIARLTHTSSPFGAQLDSLADMVGFGIAPAMIMFNWKLHALGKVGWLLAFTYCACAALRLARFNTLIGIVDKKYFLGLPSPASAALVAGYVYLCRSYALEHSAFTVLGIIVMLIAALSMVSNVKFYSFKEFHFYHKAPFRALLLFLLALALLIIYPDLVIYGFFVLYTVFSYIMWALRIGYRSSYVVTSDKKNQE